MRIFSANRNVILGFCLVLGVIILSILQDLVHSQVRNYHFYISESLLYNSFWMLFAPLILFQIRVFKRFTLLSKISRIFLKFIFTGIVTGLHLILFPLIVVGCSKLFFEHTYRIQSVLNYELSEHLYLCISIYLGIGIFLIFRNSREETPIENELETLKILIILKGTERIPVATDSVYFITAEAPYVAIHTLHKKYLYSDTLASLITKLDKSQFVRIHKSTIIHIERILSYTSRKNGDYDVLLKNGIKKRMSRTYTSNFKSRIH